MRLVLATCLTVLSISAAVAQTTTTFRDANGNRQGSVTQQGSQNVERDRNGNRVGSFSNEGGHTVYRDKNGNRTGSSSTR